MVMTLMLRKVTVIVFDVGDVDGVFDNDDNDDKDCHRYCVMCYIVPSLPPQ